ncbi:MAG: MFS transporter [Anaerolineae bacterium]|jgi:DHA3 family macrolide efflux protein-like MFS transporter|nr:MFS transporter [Anaerolineae bacterium]
MKGKNQTPEIKSKWRSIFYPIWLGQAASLIGSRLVGFALIWFLTQKTGSAIILSTLSLVGLLPELILAPFTGALVDRWNRKAIIIIADASIAAVTAVIALLFTLGVEQIWHIYVLMFIRAVCGAFHYPAMSASIAAIVPAENATKVQGLISLQNSILGIIAAPLGALALEFLSLSNVLMIDVATAIIAIIPLVLIALPQPKVVTTKEQKANPMRTMMKDVKDGFQYLLNWKGAFHTLILATLVNMLLSPAFSLMPLLINNEFQGTAAKLATVQTSIGIGMLASSFILSISGGFQKKILTSACGLLMMALGVIAIAVAPVSNFWILVAGAGLYGFSNPATNAPLSAIMMKVIDENMQGRVWALAGMMSSAASPIGLAIAGPVSQYLGVQTWFLFGGIFCLVSSLFLRFNKHIWNLEESKSQKPNHPQPIPQQTM